MKNKFIKSYHCNNAPLYIPLSKTEKVKSLLHSFCNLAHFFKRSANKGQDKSIATAPSSKHDKDRGYKPLLGKLDRYIIFKFISTYIFLIAIIIVIAVIFDFNENIDKLTQSHAAASKIAQYYMNFVPYFANLFSPLFVFIAVIFFTSKLADKSEIIAMKSTGMSFKRLLRPYMFTAALIAISSFLLGAYVIPKSNVARVNFQNRYIKRKPTLPL